MSNALTSAPARAAGVLRRHPVSLWCLTIGLLFNVFAGYSAELGLPIGPDRILLPVALVALALELRADGRRVRFGAVQVMMAVFCTWIVLSMVFYDNLTNTTALYALLDRVLMPFVLFTVGGLVYDTDARRDVLLKALTLLGLALGVCAVLEMVAPGLVWPRYIVDPDVGQQFGRARGPFAASEGMGVALAVCALAAGLLAWRSRGRLRAAAATVVALDLVGVLLAQTRSVWVAMLAAALALLVLVPASRRGLPAALAAVAAVVVAVLVIAPQTLAGIAERLGEQGPVNDRLGSNEAALRLLYERPLTGIGWRRFFPHGSEWVWQSQDYPMNKVVIEVHNVVLSRAAELGLPAAILFVAIIVAGPLRAALRRARGLDDPRQQGDPWQHLAALVLIVWLVAGLFGPLAIPFPNYVTWLIAGVAAGVVRARTTRPAEEVPWPSATSPAP